MTKNEPAVTLQPFLTGLEMGDPISHENLTLVPLRGEGHEMLDYDLSREALTAGSLSIQEVDEDGSVPDLLAINRSERMVLLIDGEELLGALQNRILNTTVLLAANSETKIPVSCTEEGRWDFASSTFASGGFSSSTLRARKSRSVTRSLKAGARALSDQREVWETVSGYVHASGTVTSTGAMSDVAKHMGATLREYVRALPYPEKARGVVVSVDGRLASLDLFDRPETLERMWERLVMASAVDAVLGLSARARENAQELLTDESVSTLLERLGKIPCEKYPGVGVGMDWRFEAENLTGLALVAAPACVHLSAFPTAALRHGSSSLPRSDRHTRERSAHANDVAGGPSASSGREKAEVVAGDRTMARRIRQRWLRNGLNRTLGMLGRGPLFFPVIPADRRILFYRRDRANYAFLSNFYFAPITIGGRTWAGVEWFYQASKSHDESYRQEIWRAESPGRAKRLGDSRIGDPKIFKASWFRTRPELLRPDWDAVKVDVMRCALRAKFLQNADLAKMLLATEDAPLIEDSAHDYFWGAGVDETGANLLGELLVALREQIRQGA
jgi:ribA/ribD-fused uncharacterized protein